MELKSNTKPPYLPEPDQDTVLRLGLQPLQHRDWLVIDEDFLQFQQHKQSMAATQQEKVFQALPSSIPAQQEFSRVLLDHLQKYHAHKFEFARDTLRHKPSETSWTINRTRHSQNSLWQSSLWIQDDICLMEDTGSGYVLSAASLCSPSHWKLEEKIGLSADQIHGPVPGYDIALANRVNKLLSGISINKPLLRYNWSIQPNSELCWRDDLPQHATELHWRVERQTLLRLPETGAVVFGIRLFIHSFATLGSHPDFSKNIKALVNRLPESTRDYKRLNDMLNLFG